jgi:hypothetical protein
MAAVVRIKGLEQDVSCEKWVGPSILGPGYYIVAGARFSPMACVWTKRALVLIDRAYNIIDLSEKGPVILRTTFPETQVLNPVQVDVTITIDGESK